MVVIMDKEESADAAAVADDKFYWDVGEQVKRWWRGVERYGFIVASCNVDNNVDNDSDDGSEHGDEEDNDDDAFIGDPFEKVDLADVEKVLEGDGGLRGHCTVQLMSGHVLGGYWVNGRRKGPGIISGPALEAKGLKAVWGNYKSGVLNGKGSAELDDLEETIIDGNFEDGRLQGRARGFSHRLGLTWVSQFRGGRPTGPCWKALHGGAFLYSHKGVGCNGKFSGDDVAYLYPDCETVLVGKFADDVMVEAREARVKSLVDAGGILRLELTQPRGPAFRCWPSTRTEVVCPHLQEDPFEMKVIRPGQSSMAGAGDGLFARVDIPANTTCAFYNGIRVKPGEPEPYPCTGYQIYVDWNQANKITSDYMDLPPDLVPLSNYRATLGHKAKKTR